MKISSKIKDYSVEMQDAIFNNPDQIFSSQDYDNLFYFIDNNVFKIYNKKITLFIKKNQYFTIDAQEKNKEYLQLKTYYQNLIEHVFTRNDILVTIGGGILQDISGFIASTLYRGIKWIFIPTTLLSQADSCIGSKTSINFGDSKNLIGSFYPPDNIYIDIAFNKTLPKNYFNSGLGEIIKFHLLSDNEKYQLLLKYLDSPNLLKENEFRTIIWSTLNIKKSYFQQDEFDTGRRNLLNYGHCFGHALESASNFEICHGEAVLIGMSFANLLSVKRGVMTKQKYQEFEQILQRFYPKFDISKIDVNTIIYYMRRDKKRVGKNLTMILSKDVGKQFKETDIKEKEIIDTFQEFIKAYNPGR
ncbi:MAG: iron-containing alcohol dehydrogenase [Candidatus Thermoplasmatota archaeon]|nr:iron-containing alcohol dehydrogenase [Candidatus Thermoplasmatota archaeon]